MRIAVACKGLQVANRFDLAENFTFYNVVNGIITNCQSIPKPQISTVKISDFFKSIEVVTLITNNIDYNDASPFCAADIEIIAGVTGNAREAVESYLTKTLIADEFSCSDVE